MKMFGIQRVSINKNQRALLLRNGDFDGLLAPGKHWIVAGSDQIRVDRFALQACRLEHALVEYFLAKEPALVEQEFIKVCLGDSQVALVYEYEVLVEILAPGTRALYWKDVEAVRVDTVEINESARVEDRLLAKFNQTQLRQRPVLGLNGVLLAQVPEFHAGILKVDGQVQSLLAAGLYGFWKFNRQVEVENVDLRIQSLEVSGQEILTKDKVGLRLNLSANWRFEDALKAYSQFGKPAEHVYRELQFGLRSAVGTRTLDELLENKSLIDEIVYTHMKDQLQSIGIALESLGVKDIILPGEMKLILAQVVEAEKSAQANVIRRREETAATRSLLNTAKLMEDNPIALRMKELETLEKVAERIDKISVFGGLDQVLNGLVKLR
jgi:regulator of protease activity HflC (stomatin/prohibitin superfamily)